MSTAETGEVGAEPADEAIDADVAPQARASTSTAAGADQPWIRLAAFVPLALILGAGGAALRRLLLERGAQ